MIESPLEVQQPPRESAGRRPRWPMALAVIGLLLAVAGAALWIVDPGLVGAAHSQTARIGAAAPEIQLPTLENGHSEGRSSLSSLRGRPVVVNFWATWCGPCRAEFPALQAKYAQYKDSRQLVVIGVDAQGDGGPDQVQEFVSQMGTTYPIWLTQDDSIESAYRIQALPSTVFVDRNGIIQDVVVGGPLTVDYLEKELAKIF